MSERSVAAAEDESDLLASERGAHAMRAGEDRAGRRLRERVAALDPPDHAAPDLVLADEVKLVQVLAQYRERHLRGAAGRQAFGEGLVRPRLDVPAPPRVVDRGRGEIGRAHV